MSNFNSTQEITIWNDSGSKAVTVDELSISALGLSTSPLGLYVTTPPSLSDGQVYPIRVSASGGLIVEGNFSTTVDVDLGYATDSVSVWSSSGTPAIETWSNDSIAIYSADPMEGVLVKKRVTYNALGDPIEVKEATVVTPSGQPCVVKTITYNEDNNPDYITESHGSW